MPFPLVPVALAAGVAYLLFGKKASAQPAAPGGGPSPSPALPQGPYVPPASTTPGQGGLYNVQPPSPGQQAPYIDPGTGQAVFPDAPPTIPNPDPYTGGGGGGLPGAVSQGVDPNAGGVLDSLTNLFSTGAPMHVGGGGGIPQHGMQLVWSHHAQAWTPLYAGHAQGKPPARGAQLYR